MNIDWSKAPADATHHAIGDWVYKWFKKIDEDTLDFWLGESWFRGVQTPAQTFAFYGVGNIVSRPEAWTGEGLPPVGVKCEAYFPYDTRPTWIPTVFLYRSDESVIYSGGEKGEEIRKSRADFDALNVKLRPLRSAEQIAAEEREKAVHEILSHMRGTFFQDAEALYDAGYRKQVQP